MTWQTIVLSFVYMTHRITKGKQTLQKVITGKILRGNLQYKSKKLSKVRKKVTTTVSKKTDLEHFV